MTSPISSSSFPSFPPMPRTDAPRPMFSALAIASSGLSAQRTRMEIVAQNLANAETTHTAQGGPYHRRVVNLEAIGPDGSVTTTTTTTGVAPATPGAAGTVGAGGTAGTAGTASAAVNAAAAATQNALATATTSSFDGTDATGGVRVASIGEDKTDGPMVYDPGHPDADKNGYVHMPNVNMTDEMMDLMNSRRLYEANATVFQVARAMLHKAIDI
ncbi:MAG TPA: flagellar basal body rod protein FlgC [Gemmatimonadaceae bacterium]|nr:flagellar basal body rod protein FlgC [Gemmatimonadaceae bacterium]